MPTYVYRREDGSTFEIDQRITEDALATCPDTGQRVKRVITGNPGLIFKGSGFYLTDYVHSGSKEAGKHGDDGASDGGHDGATSSDNGSEERAPKGAGSTDPSRHDARAGSASSHGEAAGSSTKEAGPSSTKRND